jgi:hypothetical protein
VPKCWKNGVEQPIQTWSADGSDYIKGMVVVGGDIYLGGYESTLRNNYAMYWKNGQPYAVDSTTGWLAVTGIAVDGNDVYLSGGATHTNPMVGYWKNGDTTGLTINGVGVSINNVAVSGSDVYFGGYGDQLAKYWKNGWPVTLGNGLGISASYGLFVLDSDVYTSGNQYAGPTVEVGYWKNTTWFPCSFTGLSAWAQAIYVVKQ